MSFGDDFDKDFRTIKKLGIAWFAICAVLSIAAVAFVVYVILRLLDILAS